MSESLGKKWEDVFKACWQKSCPGSWIFRLKDNMNGYKETSQNPSDFLCFTKGKLFMVECKEHKGQSIPFSAIPQYERLLQHKGYKDVYPGVTIWFSEQDTVVWVPIEEMEKMVNNGEKSIGLRMLKQKDKNGNLLYNIVIIPAKKKRVFMDADYSCLLDICN